MLKTKKDWEEFAKLDAKWSVLTHVDKKFNNWGNVEFYQTGQSDMGEIFQRLKKSGVKLKYVRALDFGCGLGRLTFPLARRFEKVYGVDISKGMLSSLPSSGSPLHKGGGDVQFAMNDGHNLSKMGYGQFDFILSLITLQHFPSHTSIRRTLRELIKLLKPGGVLYFQLPSVSRYGWKDKVLKVRGRLYFMLRKMGLPKNIMFQRLNIAPYMHMQHLESVNLRKLLKKKVVVKHIYCDQSLDTTYLLVKK